MTRYDPMLWPFAVALSQQPWTAPDIRACLKHHLPPLFHRSLPAAARHLLKHLPGTTTPDPKTILTALQTSALTARLRAFHRRTGRRPGPIWTPTPFRPAAALAALPIPHLDTERSLADWLALTPDQLTLLADLNGLSARSKNPYAQNYLRHQMPKSDGTFRLIQEPRPLLKQTQRRILAGILNLVPPHQAAHGFTLGRSAPMAAATHCGEQMVITFDIENFFPNISFARIYAIFRTLGYPRATALNLTAICTAWGPRKARHLPQGAPTSPALANLAALRLDARLSGLARSLNATYTRYADDLTFSGDPHITALLPIVPLILKSEGFTPHPTKTRVQPRHKTQTVTGITVNQHLNLNRPAYDLLKAQIHHLTTGRTPAAPAVLSHLHGRLQWLAQLNPAKAARLMAKLDAVHLPPPTP